MGRDKLLFAALKAAWSAGEDVLEIYDTDFDVEFKEDQSPLTLADRRSQERIHSMLVEVEPGIPFLGEEGRQIPYQERKAWELFWLVDPLDGTKEFVKRNGEFTVNIALVEKTRAVLGVIYVPVQGLTYFGEIGRGAYRLDQAGGTSLSEIVDRAVALPAAKTEVFTVAASRSHLNPKTEAFIEECRGRLGEVRVRASGSSIKLCHVAEGLADVYPRLGPTSEWDVAAGQALVEAAGGVVNQAESSEPLRYNKESLLNPSFMCVPRAAQV